MASTFVQNDQIWADVLAAQSTSSAAAARKPNSELDKDAFLNLLVTQLKYQDPLNPMDNSQFLAQMAQFTALEQMTNLNRSMSLSQGYSMIGKTVYAEIQDKTTGSAKEVFGAVDAVAMRYGTVYLTIGDSEVTLDQVKYVGRDVDQAEQINDILKSMNSLNNTQNLSLIGKYVQAIVMDGDKPKEFVEGKVEYIKFNGSVPILMVGEKEVYPSEVVSVADKMLLIGSTLDAVWHDFSAGTDELIEKGRIDGVRIAEESAYLLIGGKEIPVEKLNYIVDALRLIGENINYGAVKGEVDSILIKGKIPYLRIFMTDEDGEVTEHLIPFTEYKGISGEDA